MSACSHGTIGMTRRKAAVRAMLSGLFLFMLGGTATADRCQDLMAKWNNKVKEQHSMIRRELDRKFPNECARVRSKCTMWKRAAAMERERTATIDTLAAECREFRYTWGERKTVADMRRHNQSDLKRYEKDTAIIATTRSNTIAKHLRQPLIFHSLPPPLMTPTSIAAI